MELKPTRIIKILLVLVFAVFLIGGLTLKNTIETKNIQSNRITTLDGYRNANNLAKKCVILFQLDEVGKYKKAKESIYSYLSDDLKDVYFPSSNIKGVNSPSKITIGDVVSEKISNNYYMVKLEFTKEGTYYKNHKVFIGIKNGLIVSIDTIV